MLCMGGPPTDPAVRATLRYFADQVKTFSTQRIGLTSADRRVVPLTRDYQYAAAQFNDYAAASEQAGDAARWAPAVSYVDYAGGVEDVLAMCLTGFPSFDQKTGATPFADLRRARIASRTRRNAGPRCSPPTRSAIWRRTADVQVNVVLDRSRRAMRWTRWPVTPAAARSREREHGAPHLSEIRDHPPPPTAAADDAAVVSPPKRRIFH